MNDIFEHVSKRMEWLSISKVDKYDDFLFREKDKND